MKLIVLVLIAIIAIGCGPTLAEEPSGTQKQPTPVDEAPKAPTASPTPVPPRANTGESGSGPSNTTPMVTAQDTYANCTFEFTSTPAHGETDVPRDTQIVLTSNVPIDVSTINSNRFVVKGAVSGVASGMFVLPVTGTVTSISFAPSEDFSPGEMVTVSFHPTQEICGSSLAYPHVFQFVIDTAGMKSISFTDSGQRIRACGNLTDLVLFDHDNDRDLDAFFTATLHVQRYNCDQETPLNGLLVNGGDGNFTPTDQGLFRTNFQSYGVAIWPLDTPHILVDDVSVSRDTLTPGVFRGYKPTPLGYAYGGYGDYTDMSIARRHMVRPAPSSIKFSDLNGDDNPELIVRWQHSIHFRPYGGNWAEGLPYRVTITSPVFDLVSPDVPQGDFNPSGEYVVSPDDYGVSPNEYGLSDWRRDIALGDLDGDGDEDLAILESSWGATRHGSLLGPDEEYENGFQIVFDAVTDSRHYSLPRGGLHGVRWEPESLDLGDVDGDGDLDMLIVGVGENSTGAVEGAMLRFNDGGGSFPDWVWLPFSGPMGFYLSLVDLDGDGDLDIATRGSEVLINNGFGQFTSTSLTLFGDTAYYGFIGPGLRTEDLTSGIRKRNAFAFGDLDGDGDTDALFRREDFFEVWFNDLYGPLITYEAADTLSAGYTWVTEPIESEGDIGKYVSMDYESPDLLHIIYANSNSGADPILPERMDYTIYDIQALTHIPPEKITVGHGNFGDEVPGDIKADCGGAESGGQVCVSFRSDGGPRGLNFNSRISDPSWNWERASENAGAGYHSTMVVDSNDQIHLFHYENASDDLIHTEGHAGWSDPHPDLIYWEDEQVDSAGNVGQWATAAINSHDYIHIAYYSTTSGGILKHAYGIPPALWIGGPLPPPDDTSSPDDWIWEIKTAVDPKLGSAGQHSSLALDSNGNPHVVYYHSGVNDLEHAWATLEPISGEWMWQSEQIDTVGKVGKHASLAIGPGDRLHVAYYDETNKALKHATKKLDHATGLGLSTWVVSTVDDPPSLITDQGVGLYTDIIVADSGKVYIVYYDSTNRDLKLAHN